MNKLKKLLSLASGTSTLNVKGNANAEDIPDQLKDAEQLQPMFDDINSMLEQEKKAHIEHLISRIREKTDALFPKAVLGFQCTNKHCEIPFHILETEREVAAYILRQIMNDDEILLVMAYPKEADETVDQLRAKMILEHNPRDGDDIQDLNTLINMAQVLETSIEGLEKLVAEAPIPELGQLLQPKLLDFRGQLARLKNRIKTLEENGAVPTSAPQGVKIH